uniref:Hemagglutinin-neuraminidase n=1 Tax=Avulavirus sp. TaxID=2493083 RepID=A0A481XUN3_9MONO|nr:HN [Avulavirus sp.]
MLRAEELPFHLDQVPHSYTTISAMPSIMTSTSSQSREHLASRDDDDDSKCTWRLVFRVSAIALLLTILGLSIATFCKIPSKDFEPIIEEAVHEITSILTPLGAGITAILDYCQKIYRQSVLETPLQLSAMQTSILQSLSALSYQISLEANGSNCGAPIHDEAFAGGIETPLFSGKFTNGKQFRVSKYIEHLNFIPAPTTGRGCTRIPSFSLSTSHGCYTHNVILDGCADHGASHQYISIGTLRVSPSGRIYFSTLRSVNLDDGVNRKSCSIAATRYGCDLLCSVVTETERSDYASNPPTRMIHGRLDFGGSYSETDINSQVIFADWAANYPGVGSGVAVDDRILFPIYGGLRAGTPSYNKNYGSYAIYQRSGDVCPDNNATQVRNAKASYIVPLFSNRLIQQAILSIRLDPGLGKDTTLHISSNNVTLMGAEARLVAIDGQVYMYQRGSSWFPAAVLYPIHRKNGTFTFGRPYIYDNFTRPGTGFCSAASRCPNTCITGVYTDAFPIIFSADKKPIGVFGTYLNHRSDRQNPRSAVFFDVTMSNATNVSTPPVGAAYTTSTCFKMTSTGRRYCISIAEIRNTIFGEYRIVPLLVEIEQV